MPWCGLWFFVAIITRVALIPYSEHFKDSPEFKTARVSVDLHGVGGGTRDSYCVMRCLDDDST